MLQLLAEGRSGREVADALFLSPKTVASHRDRIMKKLDLNSLSGLVKYATAELPQVRVLAVSMHAERSYVVAMFAAGAMGYLLKDDAAEELVAAVRAVAAGGSYLSARLDGAGSVIG